MREDNKDKKAMLGRLLVKVNGAVDEVEKALKDKDNREAHANAKQVSLVRI